MDQDCRTALDWLAAHERVRAGAIGAIGAMGFCIGGHLAIRAALQPEVRASACFYPTGVHDGRLGRDDDAGTLSRAGEIRGKLLLVYRTRDPHVPEDARAKIVMSSQCEPSRRASKASPASGRERPPIGTDRSPSPRGRG